MNPHNIPYPIYLQGGRRNRSKQLAQLREAQMQGEMNRMIREQEAFEAMDRLAEKGVPSEMIEFIKIQMRQLVPPVMTVPSDEELRQKELEALADQFAGSFIERDQNGSLKMWDFLLLLKMSTLIEQIQVNTEAYTGTLVRLSTENDTVELIGRTADAFLRYLHYIGIFQLEDAKLPCPECTDKPPRDCDVCGGLGWILRPPASSASEVVDAEFIE